MKYLNKAQTEAMKDVIVPGDEDGYEMNLT